jgi:F420-dependent oxidoreductase-like protein
VSWADWVALAEACEEHGLEGLFRSDHYAPIGAPPELDTLDAWATLTALAARTERIRLGTMVSPVTFRPPSVLSKMVVAADHVSGGRVELGLGAGWFDADHDRFGFPFPDARTRMEILAEQLEIIHRQWSGETFSFEGDHHRLRDCVSNPRPVQQPHPPITMGGGAGPVSAGLAARFADEYNSYSVSPEEVSRRRAVVERAFEREGRDPSSLVYSVMTDCALDAEVDSPETALGGSVDEIVARIREYEAAGCGRMYVRVPNRDPRHVARLGREVLPQVG